MSTQPGPDDRTQAELLYFLWHGTPGEQERALERLAAVGEAEALDAVIEYLCEQPEGGSVIALDALRVLANKYMPLERYSLAEALIPYLASDDWGSRLTAVRLLNAYPNELAIEPVRILIDEAFEKVYDEHLTRNSPERMLAERTLGEAIMALANCGRLMVLPEILDMLEEPTLRVIATRALGVIGSETERLTLDELCEHADPRVRDAAQWGLVLMDERAEQFLYPPESFPEPPPDRLHPIYWSHRQLEAADDDLLQFLVVRVALENLLLDQFLSEGRVPERCLITVRRYRGTTPPDRRRNDAEIVGRWEYSFHGPMLIERDINARPGWSARPETGPGRSSSITVNYPERLPVDGVGEVTFDCRYGPFSGQGWIYTVCRGADGWTFSDKRPTW